MPPPTLADTVPWQPAAAAAATTGTRGSVAVLPGGSWLRRLFGFIGPGYLIAVGYMDPGNWATSLAGGSAHGYTLLWVVLLSSLIAMFLQVLCARLGIVTGMDLAQACRASSSRRSALAQWIACEIAICACDLAEVIGTAIALQLLFGLPLPLGVLLTVLDVLTILWLQQRGVRKLEALVISLLGVVFLCFACNLAIAQPHWHEVLQGFIPQAQVLDDPGMLYIAMGIVGATVMPHNLYLHSSIVQTRRWREDAGGRRSAVTFATADILVALAIAFFINAAILVTAGAVFHAGGHREVAELQDAYKLLGPLTGTGVAGVLFAVALLASGQSSAVTATLAGQVVMEGYVQLKVKPWKRRLLTRALAIVPAFAVTLACGQGGVGQLLLASQVVLSLQLPFAAAPLIRFTASRRWMGEYANPRVVTAAAVLLVAVIICLNALLVWQSLAA
ncbi:MAG: Nramp family divalent metal transporter [Burkholderiales bacterium]